MKNICDEILANRAVDLGPTDRLLFRELSSPKPLARWINSMRGFAVLLAYLVGLSAVISFGVIGLMALQAPISATPPASSIAAVSHKERVAKPIEQKTTTRAQPSQKRKVAHTTRNRKEKEDASNISSGLNAYGYAQEPRRFYQYPPVFFRR